MTLAGIDVSRFQATTPPLTGLSFLFARATYGTAADPGYATHIAHARAAGLLVGAYHFGRNLSVPAQVDAFLTAAGTVDFYVLDLESDGGNPAMTQAQASAFLAAVKARGHKIGLYHSESGYPSLGQSYNWVAKWSTVAPSTAWTFWQHRGSPLDLDTFHGDMLALRVLAGRPIHHRVHIAHNAIVHIATVSTSGCIKSWTDRKWTEPASSAPCRAPTRRRGCISGSAPVVYVTAGVFARKWIRIGAGVTITES